ncbi:uncharacterized protein LOC116737152 [Xiphophorus hellerii]|uniref:uncharacterized protein LOC116737152 n=1 Tax=Xiphophorus hellerii TaxID=8084 RepID=UPI0013B467A3|nr:uncharacterized protein LOC116737152 [Xiphophorus hellerii]
MADASTQVTTQSEIINFTSNSTASTAVQVATVMKWLTFGIGLPVLVLALYALKNLSKGESKVPMHIMFLLVSDIISFFSRPSVDHSMEADPVFSRNGTDIIFYFGIISNISLMLFIAQERHLLVAYPQCLGCYTSIRQSPAVTFLAWASPFAMLTLALLGYNLWFAVSLLVPFPVLLFFAVDSWRALHCSRSNPPSPEKRRTVFGIGAIWANYTFLYAPFILSILLEALSFKDKVPYLVQVSHLLLYLSPLASHKANSTLTEFCSLLSLRRVSPNTATDDNGDEGGGDDDDVQQFLCMRLSENKCG